MTTEAVALPDEEDQYLQWTPVIAGALAAAALSFILLTFGAAIGLGVSSTSPTWRDASAALALLSGLYVILQSIVSFGFGGYIAGRVRGPFICVCENSPSGLAWTEWRLASYCPR